MAFLYTAIRIDSRSENLHPGIPRLNIIPIIFS
jgi:hypothetical protein